MYLVRSSGDISSSFFRIRSHANFCHGYIASRMLHFFWYAFCASALAVFQGAPLGRLAICDCQVVCWSALFTHWVATFGRAESFNCPARLPFLFFSVLHSSSSGVKHFICWVLKCWSGVNFSSFLWTLAVFIDLFLVVVVSPFFERWLLFVIFFDLLCVAQGIRSQWLFEGNPFLLSSNAGFFLLLFFYLLSVAQLIRSQ